MLCFKPTQKLARRLHVELHLVPSEVAPPAFCWLANEFTFNRCRYLIVTHEATLFSAVLPAKGICDAETFAHSAANESRGDWKFKASLRSSQCLFEAGDYAAALRMALAADTLEASPALKEELSLTLAKSAFQLAISSPATNAENGKLALERFSKLASSATLPPDAKKSVVLLAGLSATAIKDDAAAIKFLNQYLDGWSSETNALDVAQSLFDIRMKRGEFREAASLVEMAVKRSPDDKRCGKMFFSIASKTLERDGAIAALPVYGLGLGLKDIEPISLLALSEVLLSSRFDQCRGDADKLLANLFNSFLPQKANTKDNGELYYRAAELDIRLGERKGAIARLDVMLQERKVYRYYEVKFLRAEQLWLEGKIEQARKDWLDALIDAAPGSGNGKRATFMIADSYRQDDWKKALSMAWTIIPKPEKPEEREEGKEWIKKALELIVSLAKQHSLQPDLARAIEIKNKLFPSDDIK